MSWPSIMTSGAIFALGLAAGVAGVVLSHTAATAADRDALTAAAPMAIAPTPATADASHSATPLGPVAQPEAELRSRDAASHRVRRRRNVKAAPPLTADAVLANVF
jgi:hypothetical protein